jgi:DNA-binding protein HU-beta
MNKDTMIEKIAEDAGINKSQADRALKSMLDSITETLKSGDKVTLTGFGTFLVSERKTREGRNPKTGETITIPGGNVPRFKAGKSLKDAIK